MNTETPNICPECGKPLPANSQHRVCPACLMAQALASHTIAIEGEKSAVPPPPSREEIADKFPQFEILECLGRGGMGVVYKARQKSLNRLVAIKVLAPEREHDARFAGRFAREAEILARLSHTHIVTIHDFGETAGLYYLVMEFVDGVNLRDLLREEKLEPKQALAIVPPVCEALQYAHDKGIVHRDIKPENLLLDREGRVKIADFGIAALVGAEGEPVGTPPYMAPEQTDARCEVDNRADIYALGVVLYEMLTGERPAKEIMAPSRKVQIDVRLDEVVLRALEKKPELRYQQASILKTQVETIAGTPGTAGTTTAPLANKSQMARIVEIVFGITFTSWRAVFLVNLSALGFLGFLSCLSYLPWPAAHYFKAFSGAFGLFGLIGAAFAFEFRARRRNTSATLSGSNRHEETQTEKSESGNRKAEMPARFSRTAIVGACWAMFVVFAGLTFSVHSFPVSPEQQAPPVWQSFPAPGWRFIALMFTLLPLGITAPFGTTILGWIAVSQIRRSAGKLHGLWLAVFDGLLFPLLVVNGLIGWWIYLFLDGLARYQHPEGGAANPSGVLLVAMPVILVLDWLIIRRVWRAVKKQQGSSRRNEEAQAGKPGMRFRGMITSIAVRFALVAVASALVGELFNRITIHWRESEQEVLLLLSIALSIVAAMWTAWPVFRQQRSRAALALIWLAASVLLLFGLWAFAVLNYVYLTPNLGLYSEPDWMVDNAGWLRQQRLDKAKHLWKRKVVADQFGQTAELTLSLDDEQQVGLAGLAAGRCAFRSGLSAQELLECARTEKLDVVAWVKAGRLSVEGVDLATLPVSGYLWEQDSPQNIADYFLLEWQKPREITALWPLADHWAVERHDAGRPQPSWRLTNSVSTFYFRTRAGSMGILQILGFTENKGVKIRYKLVRQADEAQRDTH